LLAYAKETVVAEKLQAIVKLGIANTRMKDFYDLETLSARSRSKEKLGDPTHSIRGTSRPQTKLLVGQLANSSAIRNS
jgi:Nucleotidyl transferase AbiEii toxin, Type IV TA system